MSRNRKKIPLIELERSVVQTAIKEGQIGVGIWRLDSDTLELSEEITGYIGQPFSTLTKFVEDVIFKMDQSQFRLNLEDYLLDKDKLFRSTFRIVDHSGDLKWVLMKGKVERDLLTGEKRLKFILYNVSGSSLLSGNDPETNLLTRNFLIEKLKHRLSDESSNSKCAIIGISICNIQSLQDVYGYDSSLEAIKIGAEIIRKITGYETEISRFTYDSFAVLIYNYSDSDLKRRTTELIEKFSQPITVGGQLMRVEINIGVALAPVHSEEATELLLFMEHALSQSRKQGNYAIQFFNPTLSEELHQRLLIKAELAFAIENGEFYLNYQPQIDAQTRKIIGVEVLARWKNRKLGMVSPNIFIPIAEARGYMGDIGQFILKESLKTARKWLDNDYDFGTISINVSPVELSSNSYVDSLLYYCEKYDVPISKIQLEITEGVYLESIINSMSMLHTLVEKGFKISVDDFGIGYSNLSFLRKATLHAIKIDRSLIQTLDDKAGRVIVESIIGIGKKLNYTVIAEGVETEEELNLLTDMGCRFIQGYYFSKPLPVDEIEALLIKGEI